MAKHGGGTSPAPSGGHGKAGQDISLGSAGAKKASYNGGAFPVSPTPSGGHGSGSGFSVKAGRPTKRGGN